MLLDDVNEDTQVCLEIDDAFIAAVKINFRKIKGIHILDKLNSIQKPHNNKRYLY